MFDNDFVTSSISNWPIKMLEEVAAKLTVVEEQTLPLAALALSFASLSEHQKDVKNLFKMNKNLVK